MTAVPADLPVTTPRVLTDATAAFVLLQVPPVTISDSVVVAFWHTVVVPVMVPVTPVPDSDITGALLIPAPTNVREPVDAPPAIGWKRTYTGLDARVFVAEAV